MIANTDKIEENAYPCFLVDTHTKLVEKANAQAVKFLRTQFYDLKNL